MLPKIHYKGIKRQKSHQGIIRGATSLQDDSFPICIQGLVKQLSHLINYQQMSCLSYNFLALPVNDITDRERFRF